jgi:hypothetical protein
MLQEADGPHDDFYRFYIPRAFANLLQEPGLSSSHFGRNVAVSDLSADLSAVAIAKAERPAAPPDRESVTRSNAQQPNGVRILAESLDPATWPHLKAVLRHPISVPRCGSYGPLALEACGLPSVFARCCGSQSRAPGPQVCDSQQRPTTSLPPKTPKRSVVRTCPTSTTPSTPVLTRPSQSSNLAAAHRAALLKMRRGDPDLRTS